MLLICWFECILFLYVSSNTSDHPCNEVSQVETDEKEIALEKDDQLQNPLA